jgi:hypothetical protein
MIHCIYIRNGPLPIPFGIIGIVLALLVHDLPLGLMAMIGLVGTVGVSVNASLVMVDQINQLTKKKGMSRETIIEGASSRLRAIVLTTLTTLGGVFPMAYSLGGESGFTQPLAFSLGWGLSFSTILTLFALPALLEIREDVFSLSRKLGRFIGRLLNRQATNTEPLPLSLDLPRPSASLRKHMSSSKSPSKDIPKPLSGFEAIEKDLDDDGHRHSEKHSGDSPYDSPEY